MVRLFVWKAWCQGLRLLLSPNKNCTGLNSLKFAPRCLSPFLVSWPMGMQSAMRTIMWYLPFNLYHKWEWDSLTIIFHGFNSNVKTSTCRSFSLCFSLLALEYELVLSIVSAVWLHQLDLYGIEPRSQVYWGEHFYSLLINKLGQGIASHLQIIRLALVLEDYGRHFKGHWLPLNDFLAGNSVGKSRLARVGEHPNRDLLVMRVVCICCSFYNQWVFMVDQGGGRESTDGILGNWDEVWSWLPIHLLYRVLEFVEETGLSSASIRQGRIQCEVVKKCCCFNTGIRWYVANRLRVNWIGVAHLAGVENWSGFPCFVVVPCAYPRIGTRWWNSCNRF